MRIALALGSGGARGYAHIGVLQEVKERGHEVVAIAGSSMGAIVGGLEAAGRLDAYVDWVETLTQRDVWMLLDPAFSGKASPLVPDLLAGPSGLSRRFEDWASPVLSALRAHLGPAQTVA